MGVLLSYNVTSVIGAVSIENSTANYCRKKSLWAICELLYFLVQCSEGAGAGVGGGTGSRWGGHETSSLNLRQKSTRLLTTLVACWDWLRAAGIQEQLSDSGQISSHVVIFGKAKHWESSFTHSLLHVHRYYKSQNALLDQDFSLKDTVIFSQWVYCLFLKIYILPASGHRSLFKCKLKATKSTNHRKTGVFYFRIFDECFFFACDFLLQVIYCVVLSFALFHIQFLRKTY